MHELIRWMENIEQAAADLYRQAALSFSADKAFSAFLRTLATEESEHRQLVAALADAPPPPRRSPPPVFIDQTFRDQVEAPFVRARKRLADASPSREEMIDIIVEVEFSEWNELFLYAIDTFSAESKAIRKAAMEIDRHRAGILAFLKGLPDGQEAYERLGRLRSLSRRRLLIVEDDSAVAKLLQSLLAREGEVVLAADGAEGLARLAEGHFDVIVSDIQMPGMNGLEFYRRALERDPDIARRFVFFSGSRKPEHEAFLRSAGVVFLRKPSPLSKIRQAVATVAKR